jgi:hypothetical protein
MRDLITDIGRIPEQRSTLYGPVDSERTAASLAAQPLQETVNNAPERIKNVPVNHAR